MLKEIIIFTVGAAIGGAAVWFYQERKYESILNEEIESVKKAFSKLKKEETDVSESLQDLANKARNKVNIFDYQNSIRDIYEETVEKLNYTKYSDKKKETEDEDLPVEEVTKVVKKPYLIDQGDFREFDDYIHITMDYYLDGVLVDADTPEDPVSDVSKYVGDCLKRVTEDNQNDWLYVRNEEMKADIEIFINEMPFSERESE